MIDNEKYKQNINVASFFNEYYKKTKINYNVISAEVTFNI